MAEYAGTGGDGVATIEPGAVPFFDGDLDAVEAAARAFRSAGRRARRAGTHVHGTFQGLAGCYHAPEAWQLLASTAPVRTHAAAFGADLAAVGRALSTYAAEMRPVAAELDALGDAAATFHVSMVQVGDRWADDAGNVARNNALVARVTAAAERKAAVERRCADAIDRLYGGAQWRQASPPRTTTTTGDGSALPWGAAGPGRPWWLGTPAAAPVRLWLSFQQGKVDGAVGAVVGLGVLSGYNVAAYAFGAGLGLTSWRSVTDQVGTTGHALEGFALTLAAAAVYGSPIVGQAALAATAGGHAPGWLQALNGAGLGAAKGFVAWDEWRHDPARAAGTAAFNVASLCLPGPGEAVAGTKVATVGTHAAEFGADTAARLGTHTAETGSGHLRHLPDPGARARDWSHLARPSGHVREPAIHLDSVPDRFARKFVGREFPYLHGTNEGRYHSVHKGFDTNCSQCVIAVDRQLDGRPASAMPLPDSTDSFRIVREAFPSAKWRDVGSYDAVVRAMHQGGEGSRGAVYLMRPNGTAHVINVIETPHGTVFLDGQSGRLAHLEPNTVYIWLRRYR